MTYSGRVMQQRREPHAAVEAGRQRAGDGLDEKTMLGHREGMIAQGLPVPAGDARQAMGDVLDLDVERRRVEEIEPPPAQHALPSAGAGLGDEIMHGSIAF